MEVKIGVSQTNREILLESSQTGAEIEKIVAAALKDGGTLKLADDKGRIVMVPIEKLAYVELGIPNERKVGFAAN
ncbi:unannotated protein [freshwater metagenome]|jgi:hypothetical protein|uniref:Unannotated protein n=1 Tax=freshwater metagenome TaxID=449393 RepID=A0A6J6MKV0_9ZZZZ|nr:DUF3107 family protein [Actinomycetota bacterium]MSY51788.1 DUF3107 family protein [Actinomycetota bacterium]MSY87419.1 DUF3107 family protein [Actinomycetota bacterium]